MKQGPGYPRRGTCGLDETMQLDTYQWHTTSTNCNLQHVYNGRVCLPRTNNITAEGVDSNNQATGECNDGAAQECKQRKRTGGYP